MHAYVYTHSITLPAPVLATHIPYGRN